MKTTTRIEKDSLGTKKIPSRAYYGINAARAGVNFPVSGLKNHPALIEAMVLIKKSAAIVNQRLRLLSSKRASAIRRACDEILGGRFRDQFVVDAFQMGAGTSIHMNVNEVVANRAIEILGGKRGEYQLVHPNDHVNFGQSTNDVFPTAMRIAGRRGLGELLPVLKNLSETLIKKGSAFDGVVKSARTHLQDAVPIRLGQEFKAYGVAVKKATARINQAAQELEELGIGGSAAGTGLNTHPRYLVEVIKLIRRETGIPFRKAEDLCEAMQSQRPIAEASSALKNCAVELSRICNDLRLLSSGPTTGFGEIVLPAVQAGSSIMPGKVNPSMAEMLNMVCFQVMGNDLTVTLAVQAGQLELNVMMPVMAQNLLASIDILKNGVRLFTEKAVRGLKVNREQCRRYAEMSMSLVTVLNPIIGYEKSAEIVKEAMTSGRTILETIRSKNIVPPAKLKKLLNLERLTRPGLL